MSLLTAVAVVCGSDRLGLVPDGGGSLTSARHARGVRGGQDEFGEQAADLVAGQWDQLAVAVCEVPFAASAVRVTTRNAAAAMASVMWAYQAS